MSYYCVEAVPLYVVVVQNFSHFTSYCCVKVVPIGIEL